MGALRVISFSVLLLFPVNAVETCSAKLARVGHLMSQEVLYFVNPTQFTEPVHPVKGIQPAGWMKEYALEYQGIEAGCQAKTTY